MTFKLIFFKNVLCQDLFIIFLVFRGHGRKHWAPSEILILCPREPCLLSNLSPSPPRLLYDKRTISMSFKFSPTETIFTAKLTHSVATGAVIHWPIPILASKT